MHKMNNILKMNSKPGFLSILIAMSLALSSCDSGTQQQAPVQQEPTAAVPPPGIAIDADDIAGVVTSGNGPEAGVWVIAETDALQTRYNKIVVTDDQGRYLIPDLPDAEYRLWVRGYGLADSSKVNARPGSSVDLTAVVAPDRKTAVEVYPAAYWYAMLKLPEESEISFLDGGLNHYVGKMKNTDCLGCHQLGAKATRTLPPEFQEMESQAAWARRLSSGQAGTRMMGVMGDLQGLPLKYFADWTDRIAAGELPPDDPERPTGMERNIVVTIRDWMEPHNYVHDLSGTDRRNPTVNAYGPLYGAPELSTDNFPILDPVNNTATSFTAPVRDADTPTTAEDPVIAPSAYWEEQVIWDSKANAHNPMLDQRGRVWYTARIRAANNHPDFCKAGSDHPSAKLFPTRSAGRHLSVYEPNTGEYKFIDTCYSNHHLQFAEDEDNTLWTSGGGEVIGWLNTRIYDETGDVAAAQGWSPLILDTNGNGVRDEWVEPDAAVDPAKDKRISPSFYSIMPNPADGSVWGSNNGFPGTIIRFDPKTGLGEKYNVPLPGFSSRGADIDRNGVVWVALASGHLGEFDRRKCQGPLNGPEATGDHCPEGWAFHQLPGPAFVGHPEYKVESSYYAWVDQHNTLGLGANVPMAIGNLFDGVHALVDGKFITIRTPYPLGFYTKGFEGRIDDANAGWKGRGLWIPEGSRTPWLLEGGKGTKPIILHVQLRPEPLAR